MEILLPLFETVIKPAAVIALTQLVKRVAVIDGNKAKLRTISGILSFVAVLLTAQANGSLDQELSPEMLTIGIDFAFTWLLTHLGYKGFIDRK